MREGRIRNSIGVLLRVLLILILIGVLLFTQRRGIPYDRSNDGSALLDRDQVQDKVPSADNGKCLLITDSENTTAEADFPQFTQILKDMRVPYTVADASRDTIPSFDDYESVVIGTPDLSRFSESASALPSYVEGGGRVLLWIPPAYDRTFSVLSQQLGIAEYASKYILVDSFEPADGFMLGKTDTAYAIDDGYESSMDVSLTESAEVFATCGRTPLIWTVDQGEGRYCVCNFAYCERAYRGIYSSAYSLLYDAFAWPVINGSTFYLDDFPSPVPSGDGEYIKRDYGMSIASFYSDVWWPDLLQLGEKHNVTYTGVMIETYGNQTSGKLEANTNVADFTYYGNLLLSADGEIGYHGYNHQPLCGPDYVYEEDLGYHTWESKKEMSNAMEELTRFGRRLFPNERLGVYVPPSNVLSDEGLSVIENDCPEIRCIASTYLDGPNVYTTEFGIDDRGIVDTPRIVSGGVRDNYLRMAAFSELNFHLAATHFMHPDDCLDPDRGADLGWKSLLNTVDEYMTWIDTSAPGIRHLNGTPLAGAVQRWSSVSISQKRLDDVLKLHVDNLHDTAYLMLRVQDGRIPVSTQADISHLGGQLYLVAMTAEDAEVTLTDASEE